MNGTLYLKINGTFEPVNINVDTDIVSRIEILEAEITAQIVKNSEQDNAIMDIDLTAIDAQGKAEAAQTTAEAAQSSANAAQNSADGKAPKAHASASNTYGVATGGMYGHTKLSDYSNAANDLSKGIAATPKAVADAMTLARNPTGTVIAFAGNPSTHPSGYLLCNGAPVNRTTYATLFATIGTTYGEGNGSSTFNLPDMTDKFIQGSATAGSIIEAGLPELTGWFSLGQNDGAVPGADGSLFKFTDTSNRNFAASDSRSHCYITTFSAQNYNAIYGNAETVQPPAVTMRYYIKY